MSKIQTNRKEYDALAKAAVGERFEEMNIRQVKDEYELHSSSRSDIKLKTLQKIMLAWINKHVKNDSAIIRNLDTDLVDGQTLSIFLHKMTGETLDIIPAVSDRSCRHNIAQVLQLVEKMGIQCNNRWSVDGIVGQDLTSILYLMVDLAHELQCPHPLPSNVNVAIVHTQTINGVKQRKTNQYAITGDEGRFKSSSMLAASRDGFGSYFFSKDSLASGALEQNSQQVGNNDGSNHSLGKDDSRKHERNEALEELLEGEENSREQQQLKHLLTTFVNQHLQPIGVKVTDLCGQMHDGVYLVVLCGVLGNFFVPMNKFVMKPRNQDEKFENVVFALKLMETLNVTESARWNAAEFVNGDYKTIARVIYDLLQTFSAVDNRK